MSNIQLRRGVLVALFVFFLSVLIVPITEAAAPAPRLLETDWRTGEIEVKYTGATIGYMMVLYAATYESDGAFKPIDSWTVKAGEESHITSYLENGQSIWFYVRMVDPANPDSYTTSNRLKQTPPITAFIINWPDMLKDLDKMLNDAIEKAMTPSQNAQDKLKDALDGLKDAVGGNSANNAGNALQDAINQGQSGMKPPIVHDDGNGTYTGGSTGGKLPQDPTTGGGGLVYPNPDSGTPTEMTVCLPYGVDMQGKLLRVCIFTKEQMEKMKWLDVIRKLAGATIWVMFAVWLVQRFTPQMKV